MQESKLFPVNAYISLSYYNAWYHYPQLLRKIDAAMPAEEIGDRAREVSSYVNLLTTSLISQFYLGARQFQIDMGLLRPTDAIDDVLFVIDFSRRLNLSFHRNHGHMLADRLEQPGADPARAHRPGVPCRRHRRRRRATSCTRRSWRSSQRHRPTPS